MHLNLLTLFALNGWSLRLRIAHGDIPTLTVNFQFPHPRTDGLTLLRSLIASSGIFVFGL